MINIEKIYLWNSKITDNGIQYLHEFPNLKVVTLGNLDLITKIGIKYIYIMSNLQKIKIVGILTKSASDL